MNCHSVISVKELFGDSINTRNASYVLMDIVKNDPCNYIELDFSSIEYISRSFADQFHFDKMKCAVEDQKTIILCNASENVVSMLQVVANSQKSSERKFNKVPVYKYSSYKQMEGFLLSI